MYPEIDLGAVHVSTYVLFYALAIFVGGALTYRRLVAATVRASRAALLVIATLWIGYLGALAGTALPGAIASWVIAGQPAYVGGSAFMGGLAVAVAVYLSLARRCGISPQHAADLVAPVIPLGQAIGRLGCLARGCCYGQLTQSCRGMMLPDASGAWLLRFPTQIMSAVANLAICCLLLYAERRRAAGHAPALLQAPGSLLLAYALLYGSKRFTIEFLRGDGHLVLGPITTAHLGAALVATTALLALVRRAQPNVSGRGLTPQTRQRCR